MRTSHKLTRLVLALMSILTLASASFAQIFNPGGLPVAPPANNQPPGNGAPVPNFPAPQPPGFRGDFNNNTVNGLVAPTGLADPPGQIQVSDQKPGSLLVYPYYTSNSAGTKNTWVTISNISNTAVAVHLFFMQGSTCSQADVFVCLTANASLQMTAQSFDPDQTGWVLAVAVDNNGNPAQRNVLIGNAFVLDPPYSGNYGAEAFTAYTNSPTTGNIGDAPVNAFGAAVAGVPAGIAAAGTTGCQNLIAANGNTFLSSNGYIGNGYVPGLYDPGVGQACLNFTGPPTFCFNRNPATAQPVATFQLNGGGYDFVPNRFAVEIQSPVDVPNQRIVTVGLSGNIATQSGLNSGGAQVGTGTVINGNETPFGSFVNFIGGRCQNIADITGINPRVPRGMASVIPSGQVGVMQFSVGAAVGLIMTPTGGKTPAGIRTLHKTNLNMARATGAAITFTDEAGTTRTITPTARYGVQLCIPTFTPPACGTGGVVLPG